MGEAKRRKEAIAAGLEDPGPSAPTHSTSRRECRVCAIVHEGSTPEERAYIRSEIRRKLRRTPTGKTQGTDEL